MTINREKIGKAPTTGIMYISSRKTIEFKHYEGLDEVNKIIKLIETSNNGDAILEIHLFDDKCEYRWIRSVRDEQGIELLISEKDMADKQFYEEKVFVEDSFRDVAEKVAIVNYYDLDEDDILRFTHYRLKEVKA